MVKDRSHEFPDRPEGKRYDFGYGSNNGHQRNSSTQNTQNASLGTDSNNNPQVPMSDSPYHQQSQHWGSVFKNRDYFVEMHLV